MAFPATGAQKCFEIDDEHKLRHFYEKRMAQETEADTLGEEWKVRLQFKKIQKKDQFFFYLKLILLSKLLIVKLKHHETAGCNVQ